MKFDQVTITSTNTKLQSQSLSTATLHFSFNDHDRNSCCPGLHQLPVLWSEEQCKLEIRACTTRVGSKQHQLPCTP
ncbi:LOW QUALITY PROTEIN: hypothetical protein BT93_I0588 [Corymbia citriodora subsp. variegata]|nr:LOW QUALITY PROTEIN: hypothetical protein BT93_I0588 [Corymbia citriodora subsp. variegata]